MSTGYIKPLKSVLPKNLTLNQFIQTLIVGISGLKGEMVRPNWQPEPPKEPDITTPWIAFGVSSVKTDVNPYSDTQVDGTFQMQRHELLEVPCSFYGDDAMGLASMVRDGFQIPQNIEGLRAGNMGFVETDLAQHVPDLVNERFRDRVVMSIFLRRQVQRTYPIVTLVSASGQVHTVVGSEEYLFNWATPSS